jgi:sugar phosphate isomerase/epimerase
MRSHSNHVRVGIIHSMAFPSSFNSPDSLIESFKIIGRDSYFDVVEIGQIRDVQTRDRVKGIIEESKLTVVYGGHSRLLTAGLNINDLNEEGRKRAIDTLKEGIDEAYYMNAVSFSFLSRGYEESTKEEALKALIKSTRELCEYAAEKGNMNVLLEVFDYDIDKKSLLGPVHLVERFARAMEDYENFGIMVDLSHLPMLYETPSQSILPIAKYIKHVHIGNTVIRDKGFEAYGDEHPRFGFPNSENDVKEVVEFLRVLFEIGYFKEGKLPILSFEVKPRPYEDSELVIANAKRVFNEAIARFI